MIATIAFPRPLKLFPTALIILIALFLSACGGRENTKDYFPMDIGEQWEYEFSVNAPGSGVQTFTLTSRVEGNETINGNKYSQFVNVYHDLPGAETEISYQRHTEEGLFSIDQKAPEQSEHIDVPFPLEEGMIWTVVEVDSQIEYRFEGLEDVFLPDETYVDCLKLTFSGVSEGRLLTGEEYHAKGVGLVKSTGDYGGMTYASHLIGHGK